MEANEFRTKCQNKAKDIMREHYMYVSGWTSINKPNERPSAIYEGEKMRFGRAKQCALITVEKMIDEQKIYALSEDRLKYWTQVKIELNAIKINP